MNILRQRTMLRSVARTGALLHAAFLVLFSFDVFDGAAPLEALLAFVVHSLPSLALLAALAVAWRRPRLGGWLFAGLGLLGAVVFRNGPAFVIVSLPALIVGALFIITGRPEYARSDLPGPTSEG